MIEPFAGYLVDVAVAARVVAKPFDQLTRAERHDHARSDELSFLNVLDHPSGDVTEGAHHLERMIDAGVFSQQPKAFYAYQVSFMGRSALGLVGSMPSQVLAEQRVRGHEGVHPDDVADLRQFFETARVQSSPIALTCRHPHDLRSLVSLDHPPNFSIDTGDYQAALWAITDAAELDRIENLCGTHEQMYITDGHHRVAALQQLNAPALVMLVSPDDLSVLPFQRIVRGGRALLEQLDRFLGDPTKHSSTPAAVHDKSWHQLNLPDSSNDLIESLEVVRLHRGVLESVGIGEEDERLEYVAVPAAEIEEHMGPDDLGFTLDPVEVGTVISAADAGRLMPPKTTYFAPKARSGVFVMRI